MPRAPNCLEGIEHLRLRPGAAAGIDPVVYYLPEPGLSWTKHFLIDAIAVRSQPDSGEFHEIRYESAARPKMYRVCASIKRRPTWVTGFRTHIPGPGEETDMDDLVPKAYSMVETTKEGPGWGWIREIMWFHCRLFRD